MTTQVDLKDAPGRRRRRPKVDDTALGERRFLHWAVPKGLDLPTDELRLRLDFFREVVVLTEYGYHQASTRVVSAVDIAHQLSRELDMTTGILPPDTVFWMNRARGPLVGIWCPPQKRRLALVENYGQEPERFDLPVPGCLFVCEPGAAPWVFAAKQRPTKPEDQLYAAPFFNVFASGRSCPGNHQYPQQVKDIPDSFFRSFFAPTGDHTQRSHKHPTDLKQLWRELDGKERWPARDLVPHLRMKDVLEGALWERS